MDLMAAARMAQANEVPAERISGTINQWRRKEMTAAKKGMCSCRGACGHHASACSMKAGKSGSCKACSMAMKSAGICPKCHKKDCKCED
jgi:hypothetical protein